MRDVTYALILFFLTEEIYVRFWLLNFHEGILIGPTITDRPLLSPLSEYGCPGFLFL